MSGCKKNFEEKIGVYVINCDSHTERLEKFNKYASKANLTVCRQKCVNGRKLNDKRIINLIERGILSKNSELTPIEVSINLSFIKVWEKIIKNKEDYGIILEDDSLVNKNFISDINDILSSLKESDKIFDILYLHNGNFASTKSVQKKVLKTDNGIIINQETVGHNASGSAYIITKQFAKYMLGKSYPIKNPHDLLMGYTKGKKFFTVKIIKDKKGCWTTNIVKLKCDGAYGTGESTQDYDVEVIKDIYKRLKK